VTFGFRPAFLVQFGGLAGSGAWAVLAFSGLAALSGAATVLDVIGLLGGLFLCKIAIDAFRAAVHTRASSGRSGDASALRTGLIFGLANPAALPFWTGIGGGVLATRGAPTLATTIEFLAAFLLGTLVWATGFCALASVGRKYARPRVFQIIDALCGAVIGFFGVRLIWASARRLVRVV